MNEVTNVDLLQLIRQHPELLSEQQQHAIRSMAVLLDGANKLIKEADDATLMEQLPQWRRQWFQSLRSEATRTTYARSLSHFDDWLSKTGVSPIHLRYVDAEAFALSNEVCVKKNGQVRSPKSARAILEAVSAYYSTLERYSEGQIRNPFKGLRSKPEDRTLANKQVPSKQELEEILAKTTGIMKVAIIAMTYRGFRIGALSNMELITRNEQTTFRTFTKGKEQTGRLPPQIMDAIKEANLSEKTPFKGLDEARLRRELSKLGPYTPHSFRHYFAISFYRQNKDLEHLRRLLNHNSLDTTKIYLKSLDIDL